RLVRFTHAHVDDLPARMSSEGSALGSFDLFKFINSGRFPVSAPANAFGEQALDKSIGHKKMCVSRNYSIKNRRERRKQSLKTEIPRAECDSPRHHLVSVVHRGKARS